MTSKKPSYITRWIQIGADVTEKKIPFLKTTRTVTDQHFVAREDLAQAIENVCNELADQGYEVVSIFPTLRGESTATPRSGYGYSVTDGAIITAKKVG